MFIIVWASRAELHIREFFPPDLFSLAFCCIKH